MFIAGNPRKKKTSEASNDATFGAVRCENDIYG